MSERKNSELQKFGKKRKHTERDIGATKMLDLFTKYSAQIDVLCCAFSIFSALFYLQLQTVVVVAITLLSMHAVSQE